MRRTGVYRALRLLGCACYGPFPMENIPLKPQPVNWEAVRVLAVVVGVREAARRMGISQEAAMKRCQREGWLSTPEARAVNKMAIAQRSGITASVSPQMSAGALIQAELAQLGGKTRISLARGLAKAGEHVATLTGPEILDRSQDVKGIAQTADLVHGWKESAPQVKIRLDLLGEAGSPVVDIEATTSLPGAAMGQIGDDWDAGDVGASDDVGDY